MFIMKQIKKRRELINKFGKLNGCSRYDFFFIQKNVNVKSEINKSKYVRIKKKGSRINFVSQRKE